MSTVVVGNELLIADHHHRVLLENYNNGTAATDSNSHLPMGPASIQTCRMQQKNYVDYLIN